MKQNLTHARTCVYNVNYHIVWSTKYRRKVLSPDIELKMKEWAEGAAQDHGFVIHLFEVGQKDHIHCFVSAHPKVSISYIVKILKGTLGRKAFQQFPELRNKLWKGVLWNPSYYVETVGSVSEDNIRKYIEHQQKE